LKNKGFTLIELVVAIAIIGVLSTALTSMFIFSNKTYKQGMDDSGSDAGITTYLNYVERELRTSQSVELLSSIPTNANLEDGYNYIYLDSNYALITQKGSNPTDKLQLNGLVDYGDNLDLKFEKMGETEVDIKFETPKTTYVKTANCLNLQRTSLTNNVIGLIGTVVKYRVLASGNTISYMSLEQPEHSDLLLETVEAVPQGGNIILNFSGKLKDGKDISDLNNVIPTYITNGDKVKIGNTLQKSGETKVDLSNSFEYDVYSISGDKNTYKVYAVNKLPVIGGVRILPYDTHNNLQPLAWETSELVADDTSFNSNNNGTLDHYEYRWYSSGELIGEDIDKTVPNLESLSLLNLTTKTIYGTGLANNWIAVEMRPIMDSGILGNWVISEPVFVYENTSPIWKKIVSDLWYLNSDAVTQSNFDEDYGSDYSDQITVRNFISSDRLTVDIINHLFQFDPGAAGFVVRHNTPQHKVVNWFGARSTSQSYREPGYKESGYGAPYRPTFLQNNNFDWNNTNNRSSNYWWTEKGYTYTTNILVERQLDESFRFRAQTYLEGELDKKSEPMWYGDFGEITLFDGYTYRGSSTDLQEFRSNYDSETKYIGFRTWGQGVFNIDFTNLLILDGIYAQISKSEIIGTHEVYLEFTNTEEEEDLKLKKIIDYDLDYISINNNEVLSYTPSGDKGVILTLKNKINNSVIVNVERGFIKQQYVGDTGIKNGENYLVDTVNIHVVFSESFDNPTLVGWNDNTIGPPKNKVLAALRKNGQYLKKVRKSNSHILNHELDIPIDTTTESFIVSVDMKRPNSYDINSNNNWDSFSIGNSTCTGVGLGIKNIEDSSGWWGNIEDEYMNIDKRTNGSSSDLSSQINVGPLSLDNYYTAILSYDCALNTITGKIGTHQITIENARDNLPEQLTHFYIHGGYIYYIDNIKIIKRGE